MIERFALRARGFWALWGLGLCVPGLRIGLLFSEFARSPRAEFPNEIILWLVCLSALPLAVFVLAGAAEVAVNSKRVH